MRMQTLLTVLAMAFFLVTPPTAHARDNFAASPDHTRREARSGPSLDQAVQQVRAQTGGRVLSAETVRQGSGRVHRIKVLLPSGHVKIFHVDAGSG